MAKKMKTFRELVDQSRRGRDGERPLTITVTAAMCRMSRQHFYHLLDGAQTASLCFEERIAKVLKLPLRTVQQALKASRLEAGWLE